MKQTEKTVRLMVDVPVSALTVVAAPPDLVTQANVEAVTGFTRGVYLSDLLPAFEAAGGNRRPRREDPCRAARGVCRVDSVAPDGNASACVWRRNQPRGRVRRRVRVGAGAPSGRVPR